MCGADVGDFVDFVFLSVFPDDIPWEHGPVFREPHFDRDMFEDSGFDLVSPNADVFDETSDILQALVGQLSEIKPKYGQIFLELYKGNERPLHIAKALGIGKSQIYDDVKSVRELAAKMYWKMIG